jgi:hypothetical protein
MKHLDKFFEFCATATPKQIMLLLSSAAIFGFSAEALLWILKI